MAGSTCSGCEDDGIMQRYDADVCEVVTRTYVGFRPILFKCDLTFENILNTNANGEWAQAIANGDIILFPNCGKLEIQQGNTTVVDTDECGNNILGNTTFPWTYTNPNVAVDFEDEIWYADVKRKINNYRLGFIRQCEGEELRIYLNTSTSEAIKAGGGAVPTQNPGLGISLTNIPQWLGPNGIGEAGRWEMGGEITSDCYPISCPIPGLSTLIAAA